MAARGPTSLPRSPPRARPPTAGALASSPPPPPPAPAPADRWVSRVFASPHDAGTAFVSKSGFRNDDFAPYLYKTTDSGKTWTAIKGNLPDAPSNAVVPGRENQA